MAVSHCRVILSSSGEFRQGSSHRPHATDLPSGVVDLRDGVAGDPPAIRYRAGGPLWPPSKYAAIAGSGGCTSTTCPPPRRETVAAYPAATASRAAMGEVTVVPPAAMNRRNSWTRTGSAPPCAP